MDLNGKQAAIRAGYSAKAADVNGPRLLGNDRVAAAISALRTTESQKLGITRERVLQELARVAFFDIRKLFNSNGAMIAPTEWDDDTAAGVASCKVTSYTPPGEDSQPEWTKEVRFVDRRAALVHVMRILGGMPKEQPDVNVNLTVETPLDALREQYEKIRGKRG